MEINVQGNRIKIWISGSLPVVGAVLAPPGNLRNLQSMAFPGLSAIAPDKRLVPYQRLR